MKTPRHAAQRAHPARTRTFARRLILVLVALAFAVFAASAFAGSQAVKGAFVINGSITNTDPVVTNPFYSTFRAYCVGYNITALPGNYHYKVYTFRNLSSVTRCVTVSLFVSSGTAAASGYTNVFNPGSPGAYYQGAVGGLGAGQAGDFEYEVPASTTFNVVVWETTQNGGASYTLLVEGLGILQTGGGGPTAAASLQSFRASSAPKSVVVRWRTQSEQNTVAFNLFRGDGAKRVRLTRSGVPATGDGRGHAYTYTDRHPQKGKPAHYWLQVVPQKGPRLMFGPAVSAR